MTSLIEDTRKQEIPPEFRVRHLICIKCHPGIGVGDTAITLCGFQKPIEGMIHRSQGSCVVCHDIDKEHTHE